MIIRIELDNMIVDEWVTDDLREAKTFLMGYGATENEVPFHLLGKVIDEIVYRVEDANA